MAALIVCAATAASANTGHHDSGGGGGTAACIRWEPIPVDMAGRDMTVVDMAGADMAGADLGGLDGGVAGDMAIPLRCAERASLFGCAFVPSAHGEGNGVALALLLGVVVFDVVRAR
ncbi:MAG TPA: hypothetical protein VF997_17040, partial [Polyangia bacterium]